MARMVHGQWTDDFAPRRRLVTHARGVAVGKTACGASVRGLEVIAGSTLKARGDLTGCRRCLSAI